MNVSILLFPGTNCDFDTKYAFEMLNHNVTTVWHKETKLPRDSDLVVLAGGFSYGDYLRCGSIARFSPIIKALIQYTNQGGRVLGICNGFQILTEANLLPGTFKLNKNLHYICKYHYLKVVNNNNKFLQNFQKNTLLNIPIAHAQGSYYTDSLRLQSLYDNKQVLLKYCNKQGSITNPNGSIDSIAAICNKDKNIFGIMPHPERAMDLILGSNDGIDMLKGICA